MKRAAAGFLTQRPGICLTVSAPGFLNGLVSLANATTNCFPMIQISGSSDRAIVDLQQGDYEELDQFSVARQLAKAAYRVGQAADIGTGVARAIRTAVSGRPGGVYLDLPAAVLSATIDAETGRRSLAEVVDPAPRQLAAPQAIDRALSLLASAPATADPARQGRGVRARGGRGPSFHRGNRDPVPADVDGEGATA